MTITSDPDVVARAERVVLPGDGAFADCKRHLDAIPGMIEAIDEIIDDRGRPFFGICVGMQLLATRGIEHDVTAGLDRIPGEVRADRAQRPGAEGAAHGLEHHDVPSRITRCSRASPSATTAGTPISCTATTSSPERDDDVAAVADYGGPVTAIVARDTIAGTQFHPEKSQNLGLTLIANFLKWKP